MARNQFLMYMKSEFKSLIIPILVTQDVPVGPGGVQFLDLFADLPESHKRVLSDYALNFRCLVIDVNELDRQGIVERTNIDAVVHAMAQVRGADVSLLPELVDRVGHVGPDDRERMLGLLIGYVCDYNTDITLEDVLSVKAKTPEGQKMAQSAAEILREQGREQGRAQGREQGHEEGLVQGRSVGLVQGRLEGREQGRSEVREQVALNLLREGMAPETIAEVTELSPAEIEKLRHTNNSG